MNRTELRRSASLLIAIAIMGAHVSTFAQGNKVEGHNSLLKSIFSTTPGDKSLDDWLHVNVAAAQDKSEYPKPDFSVMNEWYDVTKVEYHIFDQMLTYVVKPKVESRPYVFG